MPPPVPNGPAHAGVHHPRLHHQLAFHATKPMQADRALSERTSVCPLNWRARKWCSAKASAQRPGALCAQCHCWAFWDPLFALPHAHRPTGGSDQAPCISPLPLATGVDLRDCVPWLYINCAPAYPYSACPGCAHASWAGRSGGRTPCAPAASGIPRSPGCPRPRRRHTTSAIIAAILKS